MMSTQLWLHWQQNSDGTDALRWCLRESGRHETRLQALQTGDFEHFDSVVRGLSLSDLEAVLLIDGTELVTRFLPFEPSEKKHLAELLPFALESHLAVDLDNVQVAINVPSAASDATGRVAVTAYMDAGILAARIDALEQSGLRVAAVYALPALLPASIDRWVIQEDSSQEDSSQGDSSRTWHINAPGALCASIEPELLVLCIERLLASPQTVRPTVVQAHSSDGLPEALASVLQTAGIEVEMVSGSTQHPWACLQTGGFSSVNLRQGALAPPLRLQRYWRPLRGPVCMAMLVFCAGLAMTLTETALDRQRLSALNDRIEQRYRDVMPEGMLVDAAQQLRSQVNQLSSGLSGSGITEMLAGTAPVFASHNQVRMHSLDFSFSAVTAAPELQMSISAPTAADILALGEQLTSSGWHAQAMNIMRSGDYHQASLLVRGKSL